VAAAADAAVVAAHAVELVVVAAAERDVGGRVAAEVVRPGRALDLLGAGVDAAGAAAADVGVVDAAADRRPVE
jgi:hypothetical protein